MTAHVFLICLIFRSSLSPDSGAKPTVSPRFQGKWLCDTTAVALEDRQAGGRRHDARPQFVDGTAGRLQRRPLGIIDGWSSKHFPTRKPSRCSAEDWALTTHPCHLSLLGLPHHDQTVKLWGGVADLRLFHRSTIWRAQRYCLFPSRLLEGIQRGYCIFVRRGWLRTGRVSPLRLVPAHRFHVQDAGRSTKR
ncbi:hypothetical protein B0I37DRAFT_189268 [Chaetomium sp. MPI-CAGE-AT-0009]|nr:hypothetical protein B0I37DRAFT_189268 [Chaetomium sp. MPI-CAGE-AT-0009]